ncbi:MAG: acyl carrier protein [Patescibacteria group bacterium]
MESHLKKAIIEFVANEFKLVPQNITDDLSFTDDLNLSSDQTQDLLTRIQEALDFIIPTDSLNIETVGDLFDLLKPDAEVEPEIT